MKRLLALTLLLLAVTAEAAGPRIWGKSGTASTSNTTVTVGSASTPFYPMRLCFSNLDATNNIFFDWTDGVAATTDDSTNLLVSPGEKVCLETYNQNVTNVMTIGIIASAATPAYVIKAVAYR